MCFIREKSIAFRNVGFGESGRERERAVSGGIGIENLLKSEVFIWF